MSAPRGGRGPSGPWGRLKNVPTDALDSMAILTPSTRLLDLKTQETYYNRIVERYMKFCAASGGGPALDAQFASLSISSSYTNDEDDHQPLKSWPAGPGPPPAPARSTSHELSTILLAMRKLREAIVSTGRTDTFSQRAYIFIIRASLLIQSLESYLPALLHLLQNIHPVQQLPAPELHEFVGYHILDIACRQHDFAAAYAMRTAYRYSDRRVDKILEALVHDNWLLFWRMRRGVDGYQKRLVDLAVEGVRMHALKCVGRAYLTVDRTFVEKAAEMEWNRLKRECNVGWELEGEKVVVRRVRER
ncbi:MAG: hypothetical protein M1827_002809 [Pycnora praestabilis]|nr:MAG: hypothetical protein M1827_002809 [Pycnora praestabilis]